MGPCPRHLTPGPRLTEQPLSGILLISVVQRKIALGSLSGATTPWPGSDPGHFLFRVRELVIQSHPIQPTIEAGSATLSHACETVGYCFVTNTKSLAPGHKRDFSAHISGAAGLSSDLWIESGSGPGVSHLPRIRGHSRPVSWHRGHADTGSPSQGLSSESAVSFLLMSP